MASTCTFPFEISLGYDIVEIRFFFIGINLLNRIVEHAAVTFGHSKQKCVKVRYINSNLKIEKLNWGSILPLL